MAPVKPELKTCLVVGGSGFLGSRMTEMLLSAGWTVKVFDIRVPTDAAASDRLSYHQGNICNPSEVANAVQGVSVVFHCATPAPTSNNKKLFYAVNVDGTKCLIKACQEAKVQHLVLTSSASVVYSGEDIVNGNEELPYAHSPMDFYTETKIEQEKIVLSANGVQGLSTVAVRPHGIFGPRDPLLVPTTVKMAQSGKNKFIIGDGSNLVDFTYVDNVVHGHILAAEQLVKGNGAVGGQAYNITNDEPIRFWDFLSSVLTRLDYDKPRYHLPYILIYYLAVVIGFLCRLIEPIWAVNPTLTPMKVALSATAHFYSAEKAKRDMKYRPLVSLEDGLARTVGSFEHLRKKTSGKP